MEQKGVHLDRETFSCSICLDLLKDPVTTTCGHSYCMNCIKSHWDGEDQKGIYSCPQCRKTFIPRPVLEKNTMLAELVEQLKKTGLQAAPADHCYAGPEDVACDVCTGRKLKAFKSCLVCLASYCEKHLQPHYDAAPLKKHKLVEPSKKLQENICSRHDKVMEIFCRTDQQSICYLCTMDEHKGHEIVPAAAERTEKQKEQKEVEVMLQNIQEGIQERKKDVELLRQELKAIKDSADKTVEDSKEIFTEMILLLQKRSSDVEQLVRSQQETEETQVKGVEKKLEQQITELERKGSELKQLLNTEDHNQFLHNYPSLPPPSQSTHSSSISHPLNFEDMKVAVTETREKLQDILICTYFHNVDSTCLLSKHESTLRDEMEQQTEQNLGNISCSICLDLLKEPVTTSCGHNYCINCIKSHWDGEDQKGIYSCPQCRKTFIPRPVLEKNTMLAELVEQLKKTGLQAAPADHCYAGPEDVACDVCTGRKLKAFKSCLVCLASYCEKHLQPHYDAAPLKKHKLVEPSKKLQENICSRHDKMMEIFCRTDQQSICYLCTMDEHKGHETVPVAAERAEKQKEVEVILQNIQQGIQERKKDVELLRQELKAIKDSADKTVEDSKEIFTEMIRLLQKRSSDVEQLVRSQQETEESRVKDVEEKLEQQITELERKGSELKHLLNTEDHNQFLHNYPSLPPPSESTHSSSIIHPLNFEVVKEAVTETREKLQDILRETWTNTSVTVTEVDVLLSQPEPKTRDEFLKFSRKISLDPNTVHTELLLSEGNRKVTVMTKPQSYSDHPDRFTAYWQVLSRESLTGRCYWEVEWRGEGVGVAVAYKNISRTGNESSFGYNDKSWSLRCYTNSYRFWYSKVSSVVSGPVSSRVGVYLDHRAGLLSFYSVSETMTLLHRVQTTFTQPLYAGLGPLDSKVTAEFIKVK
ncbi:E3 ubiquitin/ISG15 ligase TRIM25-like [Mugil cephalus]|uniref:E3 ubiquitin/ISG15 ligase TRIM25-like n=1 Tax=Mugil cephalus TaxID=48193 RepID=UPI001FB6032E|nr:E3 ubiquitin/ISG15 ligase TRIM25-like [Mugil cephalus]